MRRPSGGGVGVLLLAEDVAAVVIGVDPRLACRLIILAGQLVKTVVDVGVQGRRRTTAPPLTQFNPLLYLRSRMLAVIKALFTPTTNERGIKPKRDIRYNQFNKKHGRSIPRNNLGQNNGYHT